MPQNLRNFVVRVLDESENPIGTGFLVAPNLVVTCAHVLDDAGTGPGKRAFVSFYAAPERQIEGKVEEKYWRGKEDNGLDVAFIRITEADVPPGTQPARLGESTVSGIEIHDLRAFGFPDLTSQYQENAAIGKIAGVIKRAGVEVVQFESAAMMPGMSGSPIHDIQTDLIVGMFVEYIDHPEARSALRYAVPSETLMQVCDELRLRKPTVVLSSEEARMNQMIVNYALEVQQQYRYYWARFVSSHRPHASAINLQPARQNLRLETGSAPDSTSGEATRGAKAVSSEKETARAARESQEKGENKQRKETKPSQSTQFGSLKAVFEAVVSSRHISGIILLGEPGAGKTLSLRYFAAQQAELLAESMATSIPIYLPLNTYRGQKNLEEYVRNALSADSSLPFHLELADNLETVLKSHSLVLLLDGFNEIRGERSSDGVSFSESFLSALRQFLGQVRPASCVYVITSRQPFSTLERAWTVRLGPLDEVSMAQCLTIFSPEHASEILASLGNAPKLQEVLASPFKVKAIAETYHSHVEHDDRSGVSAPLGRLYERLVFALVERERSRRIGSGKEWEPFSNWMCHLQDLAYKLTEHKTTGVGVDKLTPKMRDAVALAGDCGLVEISAVDVSFVHQQIQEYFAALWLQQEIADKGIAGISIDRYASQVSWDQPLVLLAGIFEGDLDRLIHDVSRADPFLAARLVGSRPTEVSPKLRSWLAEYLGQGLHLRGTDDALPRTVTALGDMYCQEGFSWLVSFKEFGDLEDYREMYWNAIAKVDSPEAVQFIMASIEIERERFRSHVSPQIKALARMTTPEAVSALERCLYDVKIWEDALDGLNSRHFPNLITHLRTLLSRREEQMAQVAAQLGATELIPDLLPRAGNPTVSESLLRLGAGQDIIDGYVNYQRFLSHSQTWIKDFAQYASIDVDRFNRPGRGTYSSGSVEQCLEWWYWFGHYLGEDAAQEYVRLLLNCVEHSSDVQARSLAIGALTCLRRYEAIPLLEKLNTSLKSGKTEGAAQNATPTSSSSSDLDELTKLSVAAEAFLRMAPLIRSSSSVPNRFAARFHRELASWSQASSPHDANLTQLASATLTGFARSVLARPLRSGGNDLDNRLFALEFLAFTDAADVHNDLLQGLMQSISICGLPDAYGWRRGRPWQLADLIVTCGRKDLMKRDAILTALAPTVFAPDRLSSTIALSIIARLDGVEQIEQWLDLLSDRTWPTAYAVVDALGRMSVPKAVLDRLIAMTHSSRPDKRFFAVLALGNIGQKTHLEHLLALMDERDENVKWALLWALAAIEHVSSQVIDYLRNCLRARNSRIRGLAARAVGTLHISELVGEIREMLFDSDVWVIEEAVWSLGELEDMSAVYSLMTVLENFLPTLEGMRFLQDPFWFDRPEYRLPYVVIEALGKVRTQVPVSRLDEILKGKEKIKQLHGIVIGELKRDPFELSWREPEAGYHSWYSSGEEDRQFVPTDISLENLPADELTHIAKTSVHPWERERAVRALAKLSINWYEDDIREIAYDPSPRVRMAYEMERNKQLLSSVAYKNDLRFDLTLAIKLSASHPDSGVFPPGRSAYSRDEGPFLAALPMARCFPDQYSSNRFIQALISQLRESRLGTAGLETLCELASPALLREVLLVFRQHDVAQSYPDHNIPHWFPFARRNTWSIVPDLLTLLETGDPLPVSAASICLSKMGIYQASGVLRNTSRQLRSSVRSSGKKQLNARIASQFAVIELGGAVTSDILTLSALIEEGSQHEYFDLGYGLRYMTANTLTRSDNEEAVRVWADLFHQHIWNADTEWVNRGLRRWGLPAVRALFEEGVNHDSGKTRALNKVLDRLLFPDQSVKQASEREGLSLAEQLAEQVLEVLTNYTEQDILTWLSDSNYAVRRLALHILAGRRSEYLAHNLEQLLQDSELEVVEAIFSCEMQGRLPRLSSAIQMIGAIGKETEEVDLLGDQYGLGLKSVEAMRNLLNGPGEYPKHGAEMVRHYGLRQLASELHKTVREGNGDAAIEAIQALEYFRDASAAPIIVERIAMPETSAWLALAGMEALITLGSLGAIRDFILAENEDVAIAAMNTIAKLNDFEAAQLVATRLQDQKSGIVQAALRTLSTLDYRSASGAIIESLKHLDLRVVKEAIYACATMELTQALPALRQLENLRISNIDKRQLAESFDFTDHDFGLGVDVTREEDQARQMDKFLEELVGSLQLAFFVLGELPSLPLDNDGTMEAKLGELQCAAHLIGLRRSNHPYIFEDIPAGLASRLIWLDFRRSGWFDEREYGTVATLQKWLHEMHWDLNAVLFYPPSSAFLEPIDRLGADSDILASSDVLARTGYDPSGNPKVISHPEAFVETIAELVHIMTETIQNEIVSNAARIGFFSSTQLHGADGSSIEGGINYPHIEESGKLKLSTLLDEWRVAVQFMVSQGSPELGSKTRHDPEFDLFSLLLFNDPLSLLNTEYDWFEADVSVDAETMKTLQSVAKLAFAQVRLYEWGVAVVLASSVLFMETLSQSTDIPDRFRSDARMAGVELETQDLKQEPSPEAESLLRLVEQLFECWSKQIRKYPFESSMELLKPKAESITSEDKTNPLEMLYHPPDWMES